MKKFVFKATALAIGALVGGGAFAAVTTVVDFDAATPTVNAYAKELNYTDANPLAPAAAANSANFTTKIGFGVSNGQTRYIRVDYANATLDAAHGATNTDIDLPGGATVALVQGGAAGAAYVIYQVSATADLAASAAVNIKVPDLRITSTASSVAVTYSLHETAVSAVAGASGAGLLYSKTQNVATFSAGLKFALVENTTTASVEKSFKEFTTSGTNQGISATVAKIGTIEYGVNAVKKRDGTAVTLADLVAATTKIDVLGDFSAAAGADAAAKLASTWISTDADCAGSGVAAAALTGGVSFTVNTTAVPVRGLCYTVTGGSTGAPIAAGSYTAALTVTPAATTATANLAAASVGKIVRDGTELQAPFATIHPDYLSRVVLTSQHSADASVVASVINEEGVTCGTGTTAYTLKMGTQLFINTKDICPSLSNGTTRLAVKLVIAAPNTSISGVYNLMNYNQTTGATDSLSSYPLLRPGQN